MQWDVFCQVIDNYGDAGVCWRLADNLAQRGQRVRLWIDDPTPLCWMSGELAQARQQPLSAQSSITGDWLGEGGLVVGAQQAIQIMPWASAQQPGASQHWQAMPRPEVLVEAFGCEIPNAYLQALAASAEAGAAHAGQPWPQWLNLEYLSAEPYVERMHLLQSPVMFGPAQGQSKTFFYPGFTAKTGGLLREPQLLQERAQFDRLPWRLQHFPLPPASDAAAEQERQKRQDAQWISLFAYEPECLQDWLQQWAGGAQPVVLLAMAGRSQAYLQTCWQALRWPAAVQLTSGLATHQLQHGQLTVLTLPHLSQADFDRVLWACDGNIVRGEDSLVRALWAGQPFVWHIYPQEDLAHHAKLDAFLDWLQAPPAWRATMHQLNGMECRAAPADQPQESELQSERGQAGNWPSSETLAQWQQCVQQASRNLLARDDLAAALLKHVQTRAALG